MQFHYTFTVLESHLDTFGHVNNATYLTLFEEARWDHITKHGYGLKKIQEVQKGPVVLGVTVSFRRELKLREVIKIESTFKVPVGKMAKMVQKMIKEDGSLACEAEFTFGLFDLKERKLIDPTPEWLNGLGVNQPGL